LLPQVDVSFVLVNYKLGEQLTDCLQSLRAVQDEVECEFVVVDNSPPEASRLLADSGLRNLRVVSNPENPGYAAACNIGAGVSRARYVWFLNPDVRYVAGEVRGMLDWMDRNPSASLMGPRILNPDGTRQYSARSFPNWTLAFAHRDSILTRAFPSNPFTSQYLRMNLNGVVTEVDWASGCCLLARKEAFEAVGGFDEGYFLFFEDVDLAHRAKQMGWRCLYYPTVTFTHTIGSSRAYLPDRGIRARHFSAQRYFTKNVIRNPALAKVCAMAISSRCFLSEQRHRLSLRGRTAPPPDRSIAPAESLTPSYFE
jgi:N-acetylglucosaminyl-diphospho-decaprenol L-rhamnosyltransferase